MVQCIFNNFDFYICIVDGNHTICYISVSLLNMYIQ